MSKEGGYERAPHEHDNSQRIGKTAALFTRKSFDQKNDAGRNGQIDLWSGRGDASPGEACFGQVAHSGSLVAIAWSTRWWIEARMMSRSGAGHTPSPSTLSASIASTR